MENKTGAASLKVCSSCWRRLRNRLVLFAPLHSKDANLHCYLSVSLRIFWPDAWLVAGLDADDSPGFAEELLAGGVVREVRYAARPAGMSGWSWQMLLTWLQAESLQHFDYVGIVDSDSLFTSPVVEDTLFEQGKPVMFARVGPPRNPAWAGAPRYTWAWLYGILWRVDCMTHFPFLVHRTHFTEFRQYVETAHQQSFTDAYNAYTQFSFHMLHTAFCNFLWNSERLRSAYSWHFIEEPGEWEGRLVAGQAGLKELRLMHRHPAASLRPWAAASIHAGHILSLHKQKGPCNFTQDLVPQCGPSQHVAARTALILLEGLCRSLPRKVKLPSVCRRFREDLLFESLFNFEGDHGWRFSERAIFLQTQKDHYLKIRRALAHEQLFVSNLVKLVRPLQLQAENYELRSVGEISINLVVREQCREAACQRESMELFNTTRYSVKHALKLLLQARDAYREAEAAAYRGGFNLLASELRTRVYEGL